MINRFRSILLVMLSMALFIGTQDSFAQTNVKTQSKMTSAKASAKQTDKAKTTDKSQLTNKERTTDKAKTTSATKQADKTQATDKAKSTAQQPNKTKTTAKQTEKNTQTKPVAPAKPTKSTTPSKATAQGKTSVQNKPITPTQAPTKQVAQTAYTVPTLTPKQKQNYLDLIPSTARLMFIDSVVVPTAKLTESLPLAPSSGTIQMSKSANGKFYNYIFTNEFGSRRILSLTDSKGVHNLYMQERLGSGWEKPALIKLEGGLTDFVRPYIMPDGISLYFSAKGGEDNVGGYDLYYTVLDTETHTFLRPQSLGLPYNSPYDDLYCIINDIDSLGYLVSTRRQPTGKCCIYTFVPTESREVYDATNVTSSKLNSVAGLYRIADTQKDKKALAEARVRLKNRRTKSATAKTQNINFKITSELVYHDVNQFRYSPDVQLYQQYSDRKNALDIQEQQLETMRIAYHDGDKSMANSIVAFEQSTESERSALAELARIIRNNELLEMQK